MKRLLVRWLQRSATPRERRLLRSLAAKFDLRLPAFDAPAWGDGDDRDAPAGLLNRSGMLATAFRFAAANRVEGDYFEFGTYRGGTARLAWRHGRALLERPFRLRLFDSFQGLPPPIGADEGHWSAGDYAASMDEVRAALTAEGVPDEAVVLTSGFYDRALTPTLAEKLRGQGALPAVVWVDCDLYESARAVLAFLVSLLQPGTVICFDDWYVFKGSPDAGEQRAAREWLAENPELELVPYLNFGWHGRSFIVHRRHEQATSEASR